MRIMKVFSNTYRPKEFTLVLPGSPHLLECNFLAMYDVKVENPVVLFAETH